MLLLGHDDKIRVVLNKVRAHYLWVLRWAVGVSSDGMLAPDVDLSSDGMLARDVVNTLASPTQPSNRLLLAPVPIRFRDEMQLI